MHASIWLDDIDLHGARWEQLGMLVTSDLANWWYGQRSSLGESI